MSTVPVDVGDAMPSVTGLDRVKPTILVVDDEESILKPVGRILAKAGYGVATARDAEEALEFLRDSVQPALFLVDEGLPGMTGSALCETLLSRDPDVRCVLMSGLDRTDVSVSDDVRAKVHFLAKPWTLDELIDVVGAALVNDQS